MNITVTEELKGLCRKIVERNLQPGEWALIESDDMFQTSNFVGGFDATEDAFCFSYHSPPNEEFWFQITLDEVRAIVAGAISSVDARPAE